MTHKEALQQLLEKVEAGSPDKEDVYAGWPFAMNGEHMHAWGACNGSLDAAKALHEAVLPKWTACVGQNAHHKDWTAWVRFVADGELVSDFPAGADNPARAWLIAIIKALISETKQ